MPTLPTHGKLKIWRRQGNNEMVYINHGDMSKFGRNEFFSVYQMRRIFKKLRLVLNMWSILNMGRIVYIVLYINTHIIKEFPRKRHRIPLVEAGLRQGCQVGDAIAHFTYLGQILVIWAKIFLYKNAIIAQFLSFGRNFFLVLCSFGAKCGRNLGLVDLATLACALSFAGSEFLKIQKWPLFIMGGPKMRCRDFPASGGDLPWGL